MAAMSNVTACMVPVKSGAPETACRPAAVALPGAAGLADRRTMRGSGPIHGLADAAAAAPLPESCSEAAVIRALDPLRGGGVRIHA
jgi:hypothetical protein